MAKKNIILTNGTITETVYNDEKVDDLVLFENIKDRNGHNRFIEGDITNKIDNDLTITYGKWSLSGTHLIIVLSGTFPAYTIFDNNRQLVYVTLPEWVGNKIGSIDGTVAFINANVARTNNAYVNELEVTAYIQKTSASTLRIAILPKTSVTPINETFIRFNFDLLIDND